MRVVRGGRFVTGGELRTMVMQRLAPYLKRAGLVVVRFEMQGTPVLTGHLRRGWAIGQVAWKGNVLRVQIGNAVVYLRRVNRTSQRAKGFVERQWNASKAEAADIIREGLRDLARHLWKAA
jgi:hypothetical protein